MSKTTDKHVINDDITIFKFANSSRYSARMKVNGKWITKTTGVKDQPQAIVRAIQLQTEYKIKSDNNIPIIKTVNKGNFTSIAELTKQRMDDETSKNQGKSSYKVYKAVIDNYLIPFFNKTLVSKIDADMLMDFDVWRTKQFKKPPVQSTIKIHNAALLRIFDEAVIRGHMTSVQIPKLTNNGVIGKRRAAFTRDEFNFIVKESKKWIDEGRKKKSREARTVLHHYIQFAVLTGMRPGVEIDNLTWGDVVVRTINGKTYTGITVRKGKTTKYTGTREIICKYGTDTVLESMKLTLNNTGPNDLIFVNPDGEKPTDIGRIFKNLLIKLKLKDSAVGERSLYSLRHTYITWELESGTNMSAIAKQCGTSVQMIETHYSNVVPAMFAKQLSGAGTVLDLNDVDM